AAAFLLFVAAAGWLTAEGVSRFRGSPAGAEAAGTGQEGRPPAEPERPPSAEQQVKAVIAELKRRNPGFNDAAVKYSIVGDTVIEFRCHDAKRLVDLTPLRTLTGLLELHLYADQRQGVADLGPLRGLKLTHLDLRGHRYTDLSPLEGMPLHHLGLWGYAGDSDGLRALRGLPLTFLNCGASQVNDLSPLKGLRLTYLCVNHSQAEDLTPLEGMPLQVLEMSNCKVRNLAPLAKLPLEELYTHGSPVDDFSPIRGLRLRKMRLNYHPRHAGAL